MRTTHANTGSTSAPQEQTGQRQWSWDVRDGVPFRRLTTVFGCRTINADAFERDFFSAGAAHPDYPLLTVDDQRAQRNDAWTGITSFAVDYLGASSAAEEASLFRPAVTVIKQRYGALSAVVGGEGTGVREEGSSAIYLPALIVVHVHRDERNQANYCVYLDPPRLPRDPDLPFYDRRLFVMTSRERIKMGGYWQYTDRFDPPANISFGLRSKVTVALASFDGCAADDTFQDRLDRSGIIVNDFQVAALIATTATSE